MMDKFNLYVPNFLPCREFFDPKKNNACPGCGLALAVRHTYKAIGALIEKAVWELPTAGSMFGNRTDVSLLKLKRGKNEMVICFDNEAEGGLDDAIKKTMPSIAVAEGFQYVATASPSYPFDMYDKIKQALDVQGQTYVHVLCPCPKGWVFDPEFTVKLGFWAVESRAYPLYEVGRGFYSETVKTIKPRELSEYIRFQGRFAKVGAADMRLAGEAVEKEYAKLLESVEAGLSYTHETTGEVY